MRAIRIVVLASLLALASTASAQGLKGTGTYGAAGCGLGSMVFGNQPGFFQLLAGTTNQIIFFNQAFGITFGTSNCSPGIINVVGTRNFVEANRELLAKDMARGGGETIGALTVMAGCSDSQRVGAALQSNFDRIFPTEQASSEEIAKALLETLETDASLGCRVGS